MGNLYNADTLIHKNTELIFDIEKPLIFNWTGKFKSPSGEWSHLTRTLYDYELIFVTDGTLYIAANDTEFEVHTGEYIILPPLVLQHGYKASNCTFYWLHFAQNEGDVTFIEDEKKKEEYRTCLNGQLRTHFLLLPVTKKVPSPERLTILFKQLQDAERRYYNKSYDDFLVTSLLLELKSELLSDNSENRADKRTKEKLCDDIKNYIHWHVSEQITVKKIADYYGYNPKYLTSLFHKMTGYTLKNYIMNEKMETAKALLADTSNTVAQIGYTIGFQDSHNFSSCFKKVTGLTPSEYRSGFAGEMVNYE